MPVTGDYLVVRDDGHFYRSVHTKEFYRRGRRIIDYHIDNVSEKYRELG
jgi:hypothetical protein